MQKIHLIDCYNGSPIRDIGSVDISQQKVVKFLFSERTVGTSDMDSIYQLKVEVTPDFEYFDLLINDTQGLYGFRYETDFVNLAFVIRDKRLKDVGILQLDLESYISVLRESVSYPFQVKGSILASTLLGNLDNRFTYNLLSGDKNVTISTTTKNDYEILKQIVTFVDNWCFRENKLVSVGDGLWKTEILIGNLAKDIEAYYYADTSGRPECQPTEIESFRQYDNLYDLNQVHAGEITSHYPSNFSNRVFVSGDTGQSGSLNATVQLDPARITQRADFPLASVVKGGKTYWYLTNIFIPALPVRETFLTYSGSTNNENSAGTIEINETVTSQKLYNYAVSYIQSLNYLRYVTVPAGATKRFTLPGNVVYAKIKKAYKGKVLLDIDQTMFDNKVDQIDATVIRD
jgi:hypothetical protein